MTKTQISLAQSAKRPKGKPAASYRAGKTTT